MCALLCVSWGVCVSVLEESRQTGAVGKPLEASGTIVRSLLTCVCLRVYFCRLLLLCTSLSTSLDFYFYSCRRHTPRRGQPSFVISSHFAPRRVLRHAIRCFFTYKTTVDVMKIVIENSKFGFEHLPWAYDAILRCHLNGNRSSAFYIVFEDMMDWTLQHINNFVENSQCIEHCIEAIVMYL